MNSKTLPLLPQVQRGASLVVVLILLLVVTLLGLAVLRSTLLEERMTANMLDRSLSFQSAESALREAEELLTTSTPVVPGSGCSALGICATPDATLTDRWLDDSFTGWVAATDDLGALPTPATYFIEFMGNAPTWPGCDRSIPVPALCMAPRYRITARSAAPDRADVLLQTNFIVR